MWSSPPSTNTSKIRLHVEQFSQNTYWTPAEELKTSERGRKFPHNQVGQNKRKKERERNQDRTCNPGREPWKSKGSNILGSPRTSRETSQDRVGALETQRRVQQLAGEGKTETYTDSRCGCPALPSLRHVSASAGGGWVLHLRLWRSNSGGVLGLAVQRRPEGLDYGTSTTKGARGRRLDLPQRQGATVGATQGERQGCFKSLLPHTHGLRLQDTAYASSGGEERSKKWCQSLPLLLWNLRVHRSCRLGPWEWVSANAAIGLGEHMSYSICAPPIKGITAGTRWGEEEGIHIKAALALKTLNLQQATQRHSHK